MLRRGRTSAGAPDAHKPIAVTHSVERPPQDARALVEPGAPAVGEWFRDPQLTPVRAAAASGIAWGATRRGGWASPAAASHGPGPGGAAAASAAEAWLEPVAAEVAGRGVAVDERSWRSDDGDGEGEGAAGGGDGGSEPGSALLAEDLLLGEPSERGRAGSGEADDGDASDGSAGPSARGDESSLRDISGLISAILRPMGRGMQDSQSSQQRGHASASAATRGPDWLSDSAGDWGSHHRGAEEEGGAEGDEGSADPPDSDAGTAAALAQAEAELAQAEAMYARREQLATELAGLEDALRAVPLALAQRSAEALLRRRRLAADAAVAREALARLDALIQEAEALS